MDNRQQTVTPEGARDAITWEIDGIRLGHAVSRFNTLKPFSGKGSASDVVRLHIGLRGNYSFHYRQLERDFHLIGGHHNLLYSREFEMTVDPHTPELETFGVQFPRETFLRFTQGAGDLLKSFADRVEEGDNAMLSEYWGAVDPAIEQVVRQIVAHPYKGDLERLFLLSKSIELLVLCAESCHHASDRKPDFVTDPRDKEKIIAVRDLINKRLDSPPNLSEIARMVGLNEYKLKRGFKETFRTTVFGYLTEQRLLLARQYLCDTQKTAAEIGFELGYSTPQHFNNAFKKRFGQTPDKVRKNP
jgi:AraC family transcriptional regulator, transcriptional activator of the genes for pyochelin and ferripyochelin receptors